ncbi:hypothetical protein [Flavobacterium sp.]|jgi:hypothetical protein|uniref:hypothetical protein n=1 Tax=Flavobacterium sp. TaxID=239 RepID=UPI0037C04B9B
MSALLRTTYVRVQLEKPGTDDLEDITVRLDNRDMVQWDILRPRRGWPSMSDAPILSLTVSAWSALSRAGHITYTLDVFLERCLVVAPCDADGNVTTGEPAEELGEPVDPTQPVADTGY